MKQLTYKSVLNMFSFNFAKNFRLNSLILLLIIFFPISGFSDEDEAPKAKAKATPAENKNAPPQPVPEKPGASRTLINKIEAITPAGKAADLKQQIEKAKKIPTQASIKANDKIGNVILSLPDKNFMAPDIKWYEGHWQGMDTEELDKELKRKLNYPMGTEGIFVIEVTLNAALSGMLAGDVLTSVGNMKVIDLKSFQLATRKVEDKRQARVTILRKSKRVKNNTVLMRKHVYLLRGRNTLGFAQMESAPMIVPGDIRPHPYRGACTLCHAIGKGFQLAQDPDLITLPPPVISGRKARTHKPPHEYKGKCPICHQINKSLVPDLPAPALKSEVNNIVPQINNFFQQQQQLQR